MIAKELYDKLDKDFHIAQLKDDWSFMNDSLYVSPSFRKISMGVVLDHTRVVKKVYTATIPDTDILERLIASGENDILLFSHHAMGYDPTLEGFPFYDVPEEILEKLKQQRISFYVLHSPLDKNGEYSTSVNLARSLGIQIVDEFCENIVYKGWGGKIHISDFLFQRHYPEYRGSFLDPLRGKHQYRLREAARFSLRGQNLIPRSLPQGNSLPER